VVASAKRTLPYRIACLLPERKTYTLFDRRPFVLLRCCKRDLSFPIHQTPPYPSMSDFPLRDETELRQSLFDNNNVEDGGFSAAEQPPPPTPLNNPTLLEIKAPSALPAGYPLLVQHQGMKLVAIVPAGGVQSDQVFRVHATPHRPTVPQSRPPQHRNQPSSSSSSSPSAAGPVGQWKDGFTDIFKYGICHPHAVTSLACSLRKCGHRIVVVHNRPATTQFISRRRWYLASLFLHSLTLFCSHFPLLSSGCRSMSMHAYNHQSRPAKSYKGSSLPGRVSQPRIVPKVLGRLM
jgi:hypothetical protein